MTNKEVMQMALDALEEAQAYTRCESFSPSMTKECAEVAEALRTALAQPKPPMTHEQWLDVGLQRGWINRHSFMSQVYTEEE